MNRKLAVSIEEAAKENNWGQVTFERYCIEDTMGLFYSFMHILGNCTFTPMIFKRPVDLYFFHWCWIHGMRNKSLKPSLSRADEQNYFDNTQYPMGLAWDYCQHYTPWLVYTTLMKELGYREEGGDESNFWKVQLKYVCLWKCACLSSHLIH